MNPRTFFNRSNTDKIYPVGHHRQITVAPFQAVTDRQMGRKAPPRLEEVPKLSNLWSETGAGTRLFLSRSYAIGDLLMLVPVLRHLKNLYPLLEIDFSSRQQYEPLFNLLPEVTWRRPNWIKARPPRWDLAMDLDGALEVDHDGLHESSVHRVDLYCQALGIPPIPDELLPEYWSIDLPEEYLEWAESLFDGKRPVLVQWKGSHDCKTLAPALMWKVLKEVSSKYPTVLLDPHEAFDLSNHWNSSQLRFQGKPLDLLACLALVQRCRGAVTMDSGPLWMAHIGQVPAVTLLGPTRAAERLSKHPVKAYPVDMAEAVGCTPCFESASACGRLYPCMRAVDSDWLVTEVKKGLKKVLKGRKK